MNKTIEVLVGIPASGKTGYAEDEVKHGEGKVVRINKDDIRAMLHADKFTKQREKATLEARDAMIVGALDSAHVEHVIVDDTNLHPKHTQRMNEIAENCKAASVLVTETWFDDSLNAELCHKRNQERSRTVPFRVIEDMHRQYVKKTLVKEDKPFPLVNQEGMPAIICDVDGTIADRGNRSPFDTSCVKEDTVIEHTMFVIAALNECYRKDYTFIVLTGRDGSAFSDTKEWLCDQGVPCDFLYSRAEGDKRKDFVVKQELYENYVLPYYRVDAVFDDRYQVVRMWRALGLPTFQVNDGWF